MAQVITMPTVPVPTHESEVTTDKHGNPDWSLAVSHNHWPPMSRDHGPPTGRGGAEGDLGERPSIATALDEVGPAVMSTILPIMMLFTVHDLVRRYKSSVELNGETLSITKLEDILVNARHTVDFAPARMRGCFVF